MTGRMSRVGWIFGGWCAVLIFAVVTPAEEFVYESARQIPVAADVDVVVVGGSTGAVAAAVSAAQQGASVFLLAPHPYLGEDMTATLQLWLEPGENPTSSLARSLYDDDLVQLPAANRLKFTYEADQESAAIHRDTDPPSRLTDGKWANAAQQSVQYDADTSVVADMGSVQPIERVRLMIFRRRESSEAGSGFDVGSVVVWTGDDRTHWKKYGTIQNDLPFEDTSTLSLAMNVNARYVKFDVRIGEPHERMLLGEIEILGPEKEAAAEQRTAPPPPRPLHVKKVLDDALLKAGVKYLYSCLATDLLRDGDGKLCGVVMANRAGRQAVIARQIIDATPTASVAQSGRHHLS